MQTSNSLVRNAGIALCLVTVMVFGACTTPNREPRWPIPLHMKTASMPDGYPLAYEDVGKGAPVILIHGALTDSRSWADQVKGLSGRFRIINVSLRHYYPEPWDGNGSGFQFDEQADDIASLIRKLDLGKAHIVGHSRGGAVALQVAIRHPQLTRTLVLADPAGLNSFMADQAERRKVEADSAGLFERFRKLAATGDRDAAARDFVDTLSGPGTWGPRPPEVKQVLFDNFGTALAEDMSKWPIVTCRDADKLTMPVMVIHGEKSPRRYVDTTAALRACKSSNWPVKTVMGASHVMQRQKPAEFNATVTEFIERY